MEYFVENKYSCVTGETLDHYDMENLEKGLEQALEASRDRPKRRRPKWRTPSAQEIRSLRKRLGMTQVEFADAYKLDISSLQNWEQGRSVPEASSKQLLWMIECAPKQSKALIDRALDNSQEECLS